MNMYSNKVINIIHYNFLVSNEVASLCPNADITVFPWRDPAELKARTIEKVRRFLRAHRPAG